MSGFFGSTRDVREVAAAARRRRLVVHQPPRRAGVVRAVEAAAASRVDRVQARSGRSARRRCRCARARRRRAGRRSSGARSCRRRWTCRCRCPGRRSTGSHGVRRAATARRTRSAAFDGSTRESMAPVCSSLYSTFSQVRPAVGRAEDAALRVRPVQVAERRDEARRPDCAGSTRICAMWRLSDSPRCVHVRPASVDLYMPSPKEMSSRGCRLAGAHVDDVGVRRSDGDGADRGDRLVVEERRPGHGRRRSSSTRRRRRRRGRRCWAGPGCRRPPSSGRRGTARSAASACRRTATRIDRLALRGRPAGSEPGCRQRDRHRSPPSSCSHGLLASRGRSLPRIVCAGLPSPTRAGFTPRPRFAASCGRFDDRHGHCANVVISEPSCRIFGRRPGCAGSERTRPTRRSSPGPKGPGLHGLTAGIAQS